MPADEGATPAPAAARVEASVRAWLEQFVVGLKLCPFARPLQDSASLRIAICEHSDPPALRRSFLQELDLLQRSGQEEVATTLLAFPAALADFDDYLDFLAQAQALLARAGLEGLVQLASFHPRYRFHAEDAAAASHFSNRSPYPLLHLLREDMVTRALADYPEPEAIPLRNARTLNDLGVVELERRWRALFQPL